MSLARSASVRPVSALAVLTLTLIACAGGRAATPASPGLTRACEAFCSKYAGCPAHPDGQSCLTRCTTRDAVRRVEAMRAEASDAWWSCFTANACEADLEAAGKRCGREIATKLPATARAKAICTKLEPAMTDCGVAWHIPCAAELSVFAESDLADFEACAGRTCKHVASCFNEAERELLGRRR